MFSLLLWQIWESKSCATFGAEVLCNNIVNDVAFFSGCYYNATRVWTLYLGILGGDFKNLYLDCYRPIILFSNVLHWSVVASPLPILGVTPDTHPWLLMHGYLHHRFPSLKLGSSPQDPKPEFGFLPSSQASAVASQLMAVENFSMMLIDVWNLIY